MTFYENFIMVVIVKFLIYSISTCSAAVYRLYSGVPCRWKQEVFLQIICSHLPDDMLLLQTLALNLTLCSFILIIQPQKAVRKYEGKT
jgi:hypothetical protein